MNAENIKTIIQQADAMLDAGHIEDARNLFLHVCELDSSHADAHFMLGVIAAEQGNIPLAEKELRAALTSEPDYADANLHLADLLLKMNNKDEALYYAQKAVQADADYPEAWLLLAMLQALDNDLTKAESSSKRSIELWPDNMQTHLTLGNILRSQGNTKEAIEAYLSSLRIQPGHIEAQTGLALAYLNQGLLQNATEIAKTILIKQSDNADAFFIQGITFAQQQKHQDAHDCFQKAVTLRPDHIESYINLGNTCLLLCDIDGAEKAFTQALSLNPNHCDALGGLAEALNRSGRFEDALTIAEKGQLQQPENLRCKFTLANAMVGLGRDTEAEEHFLAMLKQDEKMVAAHTQLAQLYTRSGRIEPAVRHQRIAIAISPETAELYSYLAGGLQLLGQLDEALEACDKALELSPDLTDAISRQASIYERQGNFSAAIEKLEPVLSRQNNDHRTALTFARLSQQLGRTQEGIDLLEGLLVKGHLSNSNKDKTHKLLAKLYDSCNHFEEAFSHNTSAHELRTKKFDSDAHDAFINSIIKSLDANVLKTLRNKGNTSERPVFIVGMPRSGTSLVEQILASHPSVFGAGELSDMPEIAASLASLTRSQSHYPLQISNANEAQIKESANRYLERLSQLNTNAIRVTDKLPHNFLYLGVIEALFPNARIIHIRRNPLDTCLSCHLQDFSKAHSYVDDLIHLGRYYLAYERIMNHWRKVLHMPFIEIDYENLVTGQENTSREIVEFCGLPWDDKCLHFHETKRTVATPSYDQVRRPLYHSSVQRWRNYEPWLKPLIDILN